MPNTPDTEQNDATDPNRSLEEFTLEVVPQGYGRPAFAFTRAGIVIPDDLTEEEWHQGLYYFKHGQAQFKLGFAAYVAYGSLRFGKDTADRHLGQLEFDMPLVTSALNINSVPPELRHPDLTADHYIVLAKADLRKKDQTKWAKTAVAQSLTPQQLKASIIAGEVVSTATAKKNTTGIIGIHGVRADFEVWERRVGGVEGILKQDMENIREIVGELSAMAQLHDKLVAHLNPAEE